MENIRFLGAYMQNINIGIGVVIVHNDRVLLGKRTSALGQGTWAPPGGLLEFGESFEDCARREVLEETGLEVGDIQQGPTTNDMFSPQKQGVTVFMFAEYVGGEPKVMEPSKCESWKWFDVDQLPEPLFLPFASFVQTLAEVEEDEMMEEE